MSYAQRYGNRPAAREYGYSKNTVKLWGQRFEAEGMERNKKALYEMLKVYT